MIIDINEPSVASELSAKIAIVGGGPAGIVLALELEKQSIDVTLIESGTSQLDNETQSLYQGTNSGLSYYPLSATRLRGLGGSTGHWSGWCGPMNELDFVDRPWIENSGWPISFDDVDAFYPKAHEYVGLGKYGYKAEDWIEEYGDLPDFDPDILISRMWRFSSPPINFGKAYLNELRESKRITVYTNANCTSVNTNPDGSVVESLDLQTIGGKQIKFSGQKFVLACGGIENPRLLLASNNVSESGVGNDRDQVGRHFMEHVEVESAKVFEFDAQQMRDLKRLKTVAGEEVGVAFCASPNQQEKLKMGNGAAFIAAPSFNDEKNGWKSLLAFRDSLLSGSLPSDSLSHLTRLIKDIDTAAGMMALRLRNIETTTKIVQRGNIDVISMCEQVPNPDSRVTLDDAKDRFDKPQAQLHWDLTDTDRHTIRQTVMLMGSEFNRLGMARLRVEDWLMEDDSSDWPIRTRGGHHHMGTTRMSDSASTGVVDANCRVHGISNLYVAGCSVFSTGGYVNPTLTIIALSLRLGDHLALTNG